MATKQKRITGTTPRATFAFPKINKPDFGTEKYPAKCEQGEFSVTAFFDQNDEAFQKFIAGLTPMHEAAIKRGRLLFTGLKPELRKKLLKKNADTDGLEINPLYYEELDKETEQPTGRVKMKFQADAGGLRKKDKTPWSFRPAAFDAAGKVLPLFYNAPGKPHHGKPIPDAPQIWGGTEGKVSFEVGTDMETGEPGYFVDGNGMVGLKLKLQAVQILKLVSGGERTADQFGFGQEEGYGFEASTEAPEIVVVGVAEADADDDGNF
jgi:hypothetical protein